MLNEQLAAEHLPYDTEPVPEEGVDLVAVIAALLREWPTALLVFAIVSALGAVYVHSLKAAYVATATFLPSQGQSQTQALSSLFSPRGPGNLYIGLLQSRSVQDNIIQRNHLLQLFGTNSMEAARGILGSKSTFIEGGDSIITIFVRDTNSANAAMLANAYLQGLQDLSDKMAQSQAAQTRSFFDHQLEQQRAQLDKSEEAFARLQESTGQVASGVQAGESIGNIAAIRSQVDGLNVLLASLRQSETDENPEIERVRSQISQLQAQERALEQGSSLAATGTATPANRIPAVALQLNRAQRKIADQSALVNSLNSQFEGSRIGADFTHAAIQVIDRAYPPEHRAWPPRENYYVGSLGVGFFAALFAVVLKLLAQRILANPKHQASLGRLRRAF